MKMMTYERFVEEMALECQCLPVSDRPCDGLLAGGLCDYMNSERGYFDDEEETVEETECECRLCHELFMASKNECVCSRCTREQITEDDDGL
jgi:hypothetical protein